LRCQMCWPGAEEEEQYNCGFHEFSFF